MTQFYTISQIHSRRASRSRWFALASVEQVAIKPTPEMEKLLKASPGVVAARRRLEELKERLGM